MTVYIPATYILCMQTHTLPPIPSIPLIPWTFIPSAAGRTNLELKKYLSGVDASPGSLAMAGFRTSAQTEIKAKNEERARASKTPERTLKETTPPRSTGAVPTHHKTPVSASRQHVSKQRTPERHVAASKPKNGSIPSATKHFLPRQSPKRESGGAQTSQRTSHTPAHKTTHVKTSALVDAHVQGDGTVAGTITKTTHKAEVESGEVSKKTTFRVSKSPPFSPQGSQPKPTATAQQSTTPSSAKSRLPQPSSSRIPTPGSGSKGSKPTGNR